MGATVDRLEWWCDICEYGTAFELSDAAIVQAHADAHNEMHAPKETGANHG